MTWASAQQHDGSWKPNEEQRKQLFLTCLVAGWFLNGRSFQGIGVFFRDTGYHSNFAQKYGMRLCLINIGLYGLFFLVYINIVIHFTRGAGFTAPTFGVILAALTFTSMGQHARNVWPIFIGYPLLSLFSTLFKPPDRRQRPMDRFHAG